MKNLVYPAIFHTNEDKGYTVTFPDLPGCITYGEDAADALLMAEDAACGWILDEIEDGKIVPKPSLAKSIKLAKDDCVSLVVLDMKSYTEKFGKKLVKKNTTIPAFLNTFGESKRINYSKLLTEALLELYLAQ